MEGIISKIESDMFSGLATIHFQDGESVLIESGFGLNQLCKALDGDIVNRAISYEKDEYDVMTSFKCRQ